MILKVCKAVRVETRVKVVNSSLKTLDHHQLRPGAGGVLGVREFRKAHEPGHVYNNPCNQNLHRKADRRLRLNRVGKRRTKGMRKTRRMKTKEMTMKRRRRAQKRAPRPLVEGGKLAV